MSKLAINVHIRDMKIAHIQNGYIDSFTIFLYA